MNNKSNALPKDNAINLSLYKKERLAEVNKSLNRDAIKNEIKKNHHSTEMKCLYNDEEIMMVYNEFLKKVQETNKQSNTYMQYVALRNLTMFVCAISIGLRGGDFCSLKWSDIYEENSDGTWSFLSCPEFIPEKTIRVSANGDIKYKKVKLYWNTDFENALNYYRDWKKSHYRFGIDDYIFSSRKGGSVGLKEWWKIMEQTRKEAGIKQKIGTHGLRKTMAHSYIMKSDDKSEAVVQVSSQFNHSSTRVTLKYACIEDSSIMQNKQKTACIFPTNIENQ